MRPLGYKRLIQSSFWLFIAVCSVQCAVCSVQCAVCKVQSALCSVQCAKCSVQRAACSVQRAACSVQRAACSVQCAVCSVQCAVCCVQCVVCSLQFAVCSVQCAVCNLQMSYTVQMRSVQKTNLSISQQNGKRRYFNISSVHSETLSPWYSPQSQAELDKLTCYYYNRHPLLVTKPVKIELASLNPYIYLLHDIIRDDDIEFIKDLAAPRVSQNS